jgi:Pyruvate/2-oxoacid:ferredoxin oxidoreductase delta subunit
MVRNSVPDRAVDLHEVPAMDQNRAMLAMDWRTNLAVTVKFVSYLCILACVDGFLFVRKNKKKKSKPFVMIWREYCLGCCQLTQLGAIDE